MPPTSVVEPVTDRLHGVPITDPYRWLEDGSSPRTRDWISAQVRHTRSYFDSIKGREHIRERIRTLFDVETCDSVQKVKDTFFFRKRIKRHEQPSICLRHGKYGVDEVLIDPAERATGPYTAVNLRSISQDAGLLLYEVKHGGERSGRFELFDVARRKRLPDALPHGYLRGFAFSPDSTAFYYVHERGDTNDAWCRTVYKHVLGRDFEDDVQIFVAGGNQPVRVQITPGAHALGFLVNRFLEQTVTDFYLWVFDNSEEPIPLTQNAAFVFIPQILNDNRVLVLTNRDAPNLRIVEVSRTKEHTIFKDIVHTRSCSIQDWAIIGNEMFVSYFNNLRTEVKVFDLCGRPLGEVPIRETETVRLLQSRYSDELLFERESFTEPTQICTYSRQSSQICLWAKRNLPFDLKQFQQACLSFQSKDGTHVPISLVGRKDVLQKRPCPLIMTSYGGYGISVTPQFSVFVSFLLERGCLFALPHIRGGSEFGATWHYAAKRRNRQIAVDDFLAAAEWLVSCGHTEPAKFAIFGGSNSGLLVSAALTQRPELFRAVVCMVPLLDMLRYHLFDHAHIWRDEYGVADDPEDFKALIAYSPYHNVRDGVCYPATMLVSGDADQTCNPLHARKMTARLQAANGSHRPIILDYSIHRGHSPVLPLSVRIEALTNRMAFLCDQLGLEG